MSTVLDASALLAWLHDEPGGERVGGELSGACISCVNWSEVVQKALARQVDVRGMREDLLALGMTLEPFTPIQGELAGRLWLRTREQGLSLGDRSCLGLALDKGLPVLTAVRAWTRLDLELDIRLIR